MIDDDKIKRSVSVSSGISGFKSSGLVAMSNADTGSSNISGSLRLNGGDSENDDSGNLFMRRYVWSSSAGGSAMVEVDFRDSRTCGYVTMSAGVLSGDNGELLSLNQVHYHSAVDE